MNSELLKRIVDRVLASPSTSVLAPTAESLIAEEEKALGFGIPQLLRASYANAANGGFGPGYGIIGVKGGHPSDLGTLAQTYNEIQRGATYLGFEWKTGLLPFCGWGCNIFSCVDCTDAHYPVVQSEECKTHLQSYTLEDFFKLWLDDVDILGLSNSPRKEASIVNPFTRRKTRVTGGG